MADGRLRRFKAGLSADKLTPLKPLGTAAHRRFVGEIRRNFHCSCTVSEKGILYLQRICAATESEALSPLKTLRFFSLHLIPHIKNRSPAEAYAGAFPPAGQRGMCRPLGRQRASPLTVHNRPSRRPRTAFGIPLCHEGKRGNYSTERKVC